MLIDYSKHCLGVCLIIFFCLVAQLLFFYDLGFYYSLYNSVCFDILLVDNSIMLLFHRKFPQQF